MFSSISAGEMFSFLGPSGSGQMAVFVYRLDN